MLNEYDDIRTRVLTDNTAQGVLNHLSALESNRTHVLTRWVWELLQKGISNNTHPPLGLESLNHVNQQGWRS